MTTLTTAELDLLQAKASQAEAAQSGQKNYWQIYQWLGDLLQQKG